MIHLLEETIKIVNGKGIKKIGLLATSGTIKTNIYHSIGKKEGIEIVIPDENHQEKIMKFIYDIKEGKTGDINDFNDTVNNLRTKGVDAFILGCTELSVANNTFHFSSDFEDPLRIISRVAISVAGYKVKKENT
jgi:aspartate racemase